MKANSTNTNRGWFCIAIGLALFLLAISPQSTLAQTNTFPSSGNVGIGTTSPNGAQLHILQNTVDGTDGLKIENTAASGTHRHLQLGQAGSSGWGVNGWANAGLIEGTASGGLVVSGFAGPIKFQTARITRAFIDSSGNVGIGTTAPLGKLEIAGSIYSGASETNTVFNGVAGSNNASIIGPQGYWAFRSDLSHRLNLDVYNSGSPLAALTVSQAGNLGIGTTNPTYKLDVAGQVRSSSGGFVFPDGTVQSTAASGGSSQWSGTNPGPIHYTGGNVSIGTASAGGKLHVSGSGAGAEIRITDTTGANPYLSFYDGLTAKGYIQYSAGTMDFYAPTGVAARIVTNSTERLRVDVSGNVGIGTPSPASGYKLDVNGNTNVTGNLNVTGNINAKYQDLAEWVPSSEQLAAGTVVVLDTTKSNQVVSATVAYDTRVAGVISAQPGITLGEGGEGKVLVATTGRVLVQVDASKGPIHIGDLLVTSDVPGAAMKSEPVNLSGIQLHRPGTILGKALEPLEKGNGKILVLLSLQ